MYRFIDSFLKEDISFSLEDHISHLTEDEKNYYFNLNDNINKNNINLDEKIYLLEPFKELKKLDYDGYDDFIVFDIEKDKEITKETNNTVFNLTKYSKYIKSIVLPKINYAYLYCYKDNFYFCICEKNGKDKFLMISKNYFSYFNSDNYLQWNDNVKDRAKQLENKLDSSYVKVEKILLDRIKSLYYLSHSNCYNILDFGCGCGYFTNSINELFNNKPNINIKGIDLSEESINYCKEKYKNKENISFDCIDICNLKEKSKYDLITSIMVLHSIKDINNIVESFSYLLKDNGFLVVSIPDPKYYLFNKGYINNIDDILQKDEEDFYIPFKIHNNEALKSKIYFCNRKVSKYLEIFEKHGFELFDRKNVITHHKNPSQNIFYLIKKDSNNNKI